MTGPCDVFLSYAREDQARAQLFADAFAAEGLTVWWDRGLRAGEAYDEVTETALRTARAVVVLWSKTSVTSRWVRAEATLADRNRTLVPAMIEPCERPIMFELTHTADLTLWRGERTDPAFQGFVRDVRGFVGPAAGAPATAPAVRGNLPRRLETLIGRAGELGQIARLLETSALVTLTGPGGIGKTRLAIEAARALTEGCEDGVWLVELAPLSDPAALAGAMARAMGLPVAADPPAELLERLRNWRALIVLDNCEHLIEAAAAMVEQILQHAPQVRFLVTSQEVLGLEGERVVRLRSLSEEDAQELFVRRAQGADPAFTRTPANAAAIRDICARLDGIALAIEMAGARAPALGCDMLLARLDDRFRTLTGGRRTAMARQRTLIAMLDWSHSLLAPEEAAVFRRLAVFAGGFSLEAACAVASDAHTDAIAAENILAGLVAKSLVAVDQTGARARFRLLETMRAYAQTRLAEAGEAPALHRRHAAHFAAFLAPALAAYWGDMRPTDFTARFGVERDNLQTALDWAFGPDGDTGLGVTLAANGFILLAGARQQRWVETALAHGAGAPAPERERLHAARLLAAVYSFQGDDMLITEARRVVTAGADRLALTTLLSAEATFRVVTARGQGLDAITADLAALAWPARTRAGLMILARETLALSHAEDVDLAVLRARSDALIAAARDAGQVDTIHITYAFSETTDIPWREDPDRAIAAAREVADAGLERPDSEAGMYATANLAGRLACALAERAGPGDLEEVRALLARVERRCGFIVPHLRYALAAFCLADGRATDAARVIGWYLAMPLSAAATTPLRQRIIARVKAALPAADYDAACGEGSRMGDQQIRDLALAGERGAATSA